MTHPFTHATEAEYHAWLRDTRAAIGGGAVWSILQGRNLGKVWDRVMGLERNIAHVPAIQRGVALEPLAKQKFAQEYEPVQDVDAIYDPERPWLRARVDGLLANDGVLEVKVLGSASFDDTVLHGPKPGYKWQLQHYLHVTRRPRGVFCVLHPERWLLHVVEVAVDPAYITHALPLLDAFWNDYVLPRRRPSDRATGFDVPVLPATTFAAGDDAWRGALVEYKLAKRAREQAEADEERWKGVLKDMCAATGQSRVAVPGVGRLTYTEGTHRSFDIQRFAAEHAALDLTPWYRQTATRTLRVTLDAEDAP